MTQHEIIGKIIQIAEKYKTEKYGIYLLNFVALPVSTLVYPALLISVANTQKADINYNRTDISLKILRLNNALSICEADFKTAVKNGAPSQNDYEFVMGLVQKLQTLACCKIIVADLKILGIGEVEKNTYINLVGLYIMEVELSIKTPVVDYKNLFND